MILTTAPTSPRVGPLSSGTPETRPTKLIGSLTHDDVRLSLLHPRSESGPGPHEQVGNQMMGVGWESPRGRFGISVYELLPGPTPSVTHGNIRRDTWDSGKEIFSDSGSTD